MSDSLHDKLIELRSLMQYFELIANIANSKWLIRNVTDEGIGHGLNHGTRVVFTDENLETIVDRALNYAKNGPDKEVLKASAEVTVLFKKRTLIQGDTISVIVNGYEDPNIEEIEQLITDMNWSYGRFSIEIYYFGHNEI